MLIEVHRTGGVAGITRRGVIDTTERADAADWAALVTQAQPVTAVQAQPADVMPDTFTWTIRLDSEHLELGDQALTGPLRELAERALREGRVPPG